MIDIKNIINDIDKRREESITTDKPLCKCGNTNLFNRSNQRTLSVFVCDDCDIDIYVWRS